jgi:hypothetical protein
MKHIKPTYQEVMRNCRIFVAKEPRQRYYTWASKVMAEACGKVLAKDIDFGGVVSSIMILEYSWNNMFYDEGLFDCVRLAGCIEKHAIQISRFRQCNLNLFNESDQGDIVSLFVDILDGLSKSTFPFRSPVAVGKCLHLLCPKFFPLWDSHIAEGTDCYWGTPVDPNTAVNSYTDFMKCTQEIIDHITHEFSDKNNIPLENAVDDILKEYENTVERRNIEMTILKLVDEFLYVEYTHPKLKIGFVDH